MNIKNKIVELFDKSDQMFSYAEAKGVGGDEIKYHERGIVFFIENIYF